jgi:hypothetical protein
MFVPCIIRHSRNNQHNAQICTSALFHMLAPTCFGSSLPPSLTEVSHAVWHGALLGVNGGTKDEGLEYKRP